VTTVDAPIGPRAPGGSAVRNAREYFFSDAGRAVITVLGLIWLLDGALQFQSFMYSRGFVQLLLDTASGQPQWLAASIKWTANIYGSNLTLWNTLAALTQVGIGLGLLFRPTVKTALVVSFAWTLIVWWFSEAFGLMFTDTASALTGAPGAVVLYAVVGLIAWPNGRAGGLLGVRGARIAWAALWLSMAWTWLLGPNSTANATADALRGAPSGAAWLASVQHGVASAAAGNGLAIAVALALVSAAIGVAVAADWHARTFLAVAVALNIAYWALGQGFGGILAGGATDPNAAPLFVLLAFAIGATLRVQEPTRRAEPGRTARRGQPEFATSRESAIT
jgi:hypothetical protein